MFFFGSFEHSLDNKGRLMIPSKIKAVCTPMLYIMKGFDGCVSVYCSDAFEALVKEIQSLPFNQRDNRSYIRAQLASVVEIQIDKTGRMALPAPILKKYGIGNQVIVLGVGDHFEIWDKEAYEKYDEDLNENFEDVAERIHGRE